MTIIVEGLNERNMTAQAEQMKAGHYGFCDGANAIWKENLDQLPEGIIWFSLGIIGFSSVIVVLSVYV